MMRRTLLTLGSVALLLLVGAYAAYASSNDETAEPVDRTPLHVDVVCDASNSGLEAACTSEALTSTYALWVATAIRRPRSSFSVLLVGTARDQTHELARVEVPEHWGPGLAARRTAFVQKGRGDVVAIDLTDGGSAIAEAINLSARRLAERDGRNKVMVVLSDLRQDARGGLHFERRVPAARRFTRWLAEQALVRDLSGVRLIVCGVHAERGPGARGYSAQDEAQLRIAWSAAFATMGQPSVELRSTCDAATFARIAERFPHQPNALTAPSGQ